MMPVDLSEAKAADGMRTAVGAGVDVDGADASKKAKTQTLATDGSEGAGDSAHVSAKKARMDDGLKQAQLKFGRL